MRDKVFIIGGLGHVGLTLAAVLNSYYEVTCYDINNAALSFFLRHKKATFNEPELNGILANSTIKATGNKNDIEGSRWVVVTIGTTIDEYGNPRLDRIFDMFKEWRDLFTKDMTIVLRSTVYPGTTSKIERMLRSHGVHSTITFCPERTAEAHAIKELRTLPQIISSNSPDGISEASKLFEPIGVKLKILKDTTSGELAKLYTNSYRYVNFAISNYMFIMAHKMGCDFYDIFYAIKDEYPRMAGFPAPGFTAGYCLMKDTKQLASYDYEFNLGYEAAKVNEGLPLFLFRKMRDKYGDFYGKTVGLLGMAFKPDTDDIRDSLAYRMKKILRNEAIVICTDEYVKDPTFVTLPTFIEMSDFVVVTCPHSVYKDINFRVPVIDVWNFFGKGSGI